RRAAALIDVSAVRRAADRDDVRTEVRDDPRRDLVARPVRRVDDDLEPVQRHPLGYRAAYEPHVVAARGRRLQCAAEGLRLARDGCLLETGFDRLLELVGQLLAVAA